MKNYYAVARGHKTGLFETWDECKTQTHGFKGALFQGFKMKSDAEKFLRENGIEASSPPEKDEFDDMDFLNSIDLTDFESPCSNDLLHPKKRKQVEEQGVQQKKLKVKGFLNIFTDGGCLMNGSKNAIAGIGVYFENFEDKSISRKLDGSGVTNNRAELTAIIECLRAVDKSQDVLIHTDSEYAINGILGINIVYKNSDLFKEINSLIKERTGRTKFKKVEGHSGLKDGNHHADRLATRAMTQN